MTTMSFSLPDEMKSFIEAQIARDGYASADEYVRALILADQKRRAKRDLDAKLLEGLQGPAIVLDAAEWDSIEREARERFDRETSHP